MTWDRGGFFVAAAVLLPLLLAVSPYVDLGGDNQRYFLLGHAFWSGDGPRAIWLAEPAYETIQPWGWPLLLGGLTLPFRPFGLSGEIVGAQIVNALLWSGVAIASFRFARLFVAPPFATVASLVTVASPLGFYTAATFWSEPLFLLLTLLSLEASTRIWQPGADGERRNAGVSSLLAAASFWVRLPGLATVGAALPGLWRTRPAMIPVVAILLGIWFGISWLGSTGVIPSLGEPGYSEVIMSTDAYAKGAEPVSLTGLIQRGLSNLYHHALRTLPIAYFPAQDFPGFTLARVLLLAVLGFGAAALCARTPWRALLPIGIYVFLNTGALAAVSNVNARLIVALFPIVGLALAGGLEAACRARSSRVVHGVAAACLAIVAALQVPGIVRQVSAARATIEVGSSWPYRPDFRPFFEASEWFRDHSPPDAAVLTLRQTAFYLISERVGIDWSRTERASDICERMDRIATTRPVFALDQPSDVSAFGIAAVFSDMVETCGDRLESVATGVTGAVVFRYRRLEGEPGEG